MHAAHNAGKTLQGSAQNSMNGLLFQLSSLSLVATELFNTVLSSSKDSLARVQNLSARVQVVKQKLPQLEEMVYSGINKDLFYATRGYQLTDENKAVLLKKNQQNLKRVDNMSPALNIAYDTCFPLPKFDPLLNEQHPKQNCQRDYSDDKFFFESWVKAELAKQQKRKNERKKKNKALKRANSSAKIEKKEVAKIQTYRQRFNKEGELIIENSPPKGSNLSEAMMNTQMPNSNPDAPPSPTSSWVSQDSTPTTAMNNQDDLFDMMKAPPPYVSQQFAQ